MHSRRLDPIPYGLALGIAGTMYLGGPTPPAPIHPTRAGAPSCPVSVGTQIKAVKAFGEMLPVFRHPRCLNCHGGLDVHSERHPGADQIEGLDRMADFPGFREKCQDCHDGLVGWVTPPEMLSFAGKSDEDLCRQMKETEATGERFVGHIRDDHGEIQFIAAGYAGDRALGLEELARLGLTADKPPGTQAQLTQKAEEWVRLLGAGYEASHDCGCVLPKVKLEVHHSSAFVVPRGFPPRTETEARFTVELTPMGDDKPNMYRGARELTREIRLTLPSHCTGSGARGERWEFYAAVDTARGAVKVWRSVIGDEEEGGIDCRLPRGSSHTGIFPGAVLDMLGTGELEMPADSGSSKTLTEGSRGYSESLTITVLDTP